MKMKNFAWSFSVVLSVALGVAGQAADREEVVVGGLAEAVYGDATAKMICKEKLGDLVVLFVGPWSVDNLRAVGDICRREGKKMLMDETFDRGTGKLKDRYEPYWPEFRKTMEEYRDVIIASNVMSEHGGLAFNWPWSTVETFTTPPRPAKTYAEAEAGVVSTLKAAVAEAERRGVPRPYFSIEPTMGSAWLFRGGIDFAHIEVIYGRDLERRTSATLGAVRALSQNKSYGADMAMVWYGGNQHDGLWEKRWRTSLFHAYLRGANPIYSEHGIMDYNALGKELGTDDPRVRAYRRVLAEFADWARTHPRAKGLPLAAVAAVQGKHDSFVGGWQTHLYGQRLDEAWRTGKHEKAWDVFNELYRRQEWADRDQCGEWNFSGNPPLGTADILPYDAKGDCFNGYKTLFFLGRNTMDDELYGKLKDFVAQGGHLVVAACHFDTAESPKDAFRPYNDGDWSELTGLKMVPGKETRYAYGLKFRAWSGNWDPWFTDGGFRKPVLEEVGAKVVAAESDRFNDADCFARPGAGVVYENKVGKGRVTFVASIDPVGADGVRPLYSYVLDRAMERTEVWPKVVCPDSVRWAVYPDGTVYFFNTDDMRMEVLLFRSPDSRAERFVLGPREMCERSGLLHANPVPVVITIDDGLRTGLTIMAPALEKRGWRGTYNIVTDNIGKPALLTWRDVCELVQRGHAVTTHTKSHANLGKLAQAGKTDIVRAEIADSADRIAAETGIRPHYLCLPWGSGAPAVDDIAASCGLERFAVRREVCGKCSPAGTDMGPRARIERRIAAGDRAVDLMIHGVTPVGGGYEAFETAADFEAFLDEVAACTNAVVTDYRTAQDAVRRTAPAPARIEMVVRTDHTNALYRCGETAAFSVTVSDGAALMRTGTVSVVLDNFGTNVLAKRTFDLAQGNPVVVTGTRETPGFLRLKVSGMGEPKVWSVGYEPERIRAVTRMPDGFDAFWAEARRKLAAEVPLDPQVAKVPERCTAAFDFYRISFATFGRRVYGYMSVPTDAARSPFPLELQISAAGFGGWTNDMAGEPDRIRVFFGVYPFEPDWKWRTSGLKAQYDAMDRELRSRYACSSYATAGAGVSREECFFYPVILGIDRAVDWLAARPDVDRRRIRYQGASQGAGLGMAVTALNKNISRAAFAVPALTDTLAGQAGRQSGWPQPVESQRRAEAKKVAERVMPFFDATCFATRITCPVRFAVGFADTICPPHCTYAAFNALASKDKALVYGVGMGHTCWPRYSKALSDWLK